LCCGAGGGCFWKEESEGSRINHMRFDQLNEAKPEMLAVGCPFRMTQMEDAMKARSMEEKMRVRDISELNARTKTFKQTTEKWKNKEENVSAITNNATSL
jgi:Fe-S oxidoreductase